MKKLTVGFAFLIPVFLFAAEEMPEVPVVEFIMAVISAIGGLKGATALAVAAAVVQLMMMFLKTPLAMFAAKYKLVAVYGLSIVSGIIALRIAGVALPAALVDASTLAAVQVFLHQIYKQFIEKPQA